MASYPSFLYEPGFFGVFNNPTQVNRIFRNPSIFLLSFVVILADRLQIVDYNMRYVGASDQRSEGKMKIEINEMGK